MPISEDDLEKEVVNKRIHFWNRMYRLSLILLILVAIGIQLSVNAQNKKATLDARAANAQRQQGLKDYIKCLSLLRFDYTPEQLTTKNDVSKALDSCAAKQ